MDYETFLVKSNGFHLGYVHGRFMEKEEYVYKKKAIRGISSNKIGFSYCTTNRECFNAKEMISSTSKYSKSANFTFVPDLKTQGIKTIDKRLEDLSFDGMAKEIKSSVKLANQKEIDLSIYVDVYTEYIQIENTNGLDKAYRRTNMSVYVEGKHKNGTVASFYDSNISPIDIQSSTKHVLEKINFLKTGKKLNKKLPVVFTTRAILPLISILFTHLSAKSVRTGFSKFATGLGSEVISNEITISDFGGYDGPRKRPIDDEGIPSTKRDIITNGVLNRNLYNMEEWFLSNNTDPEWKSDLGFTTRGPNLRPDIDVSNVEIAPGNHNFDSEYDEYIVVDDYHGIHTANTSTGDFGVSVVEAWIDGKETEPLKPFALSGNIFDLFKSAKLASKQSRYMWLTSPYLLSDEIDVIA